MATRLLADGFERLAPGLLAAWREIPVTIASDVSPDRIVIDPLIRPLRPLPLGVRMVGQAVTAWCERGDFGAMLHALDLSQAGDVVVVDAGGCLQTAYAGEILCGHARRRGIAGLVIDGALRDIDTIASWPDFPAYARGNTARGPLSKDKGTVMGEILLGGVIVRPGDIILGDNDGIAVIPLARASGMLEQARMRICMEARWSAALESGATLREALAVPDAVPPLRE